MKTSRWVLAAALAGSLALPGPALARALSVNVSTDRGDEGVYQPGERIQIKVKATDDAHLMVYEIDAQGYVHVLFPYEGGSDWIEAGQSMRLPQDESSAELVVQGPVGEGYVVAVASSDRFKGLPWYLRPYDSKGDEMGYYGRPSDQSEEEGVMGRGSQEPSVELPESVTLEDEDDGGSALKLEKRVNEKGVVFYSRKIDWRNPKEED